ncbi:hypothetical protein ABFW14_03700 [Mycolicibacterium fortuitum]|uniref:hypothetical protein n=3 Tax=Mycolicibacterium TaxID=1866885 RepID=UPI0007EC6785|nr:hypothetical protein [Mycolicibacterium fortuitum]OBK09191.1 hypothetical protein A5637_30410 [Mycolicibacterium fortuitum]
MAGQTKWLAFSALLLLASTELIGFALSLVPWPTLNLLSTRVDLKSSWNPLVFIAKPVDPTQYNSLIGTVAAVEATFLALFYATVAVVASTAYSAVPGDIRELFIASRIGAVYTRGIVRAFVFSAALLTVGAVDGDARVLTLVVATCMVMLAALRLLIVGTAPFNFFDPSALTETLPEKFVRSLAVAAHRPTATDEGSQRQSHREAATVLEHYRRIADLLTSRSVLNSNAPLQVAHQLLNLNIAYSAVKDLIPSKSYWWSRITSYPNWFTMSSSELQMLLATSTGSGGTVGEDHLWVERQSSSDIGQLLGAHNTEQLGAFTGFADRATGHVRRLSARLQLDEAYLFEQQLSAAIWTAVNSQTTGDENERFLHQRDRVVASQRAVLLLTNVWLGLVDAADSIRHADILDVTNRAISAKKRKDDVPYPRQLVSLVEDFRERLSMESASEGVTVTPRWWLRHHVAKVLAAQLVDACLSATVRFSAGTVPVVDAAIDIGDWEVASMTALAGLELTSKVENLTPVIRAALAHLEESRAPAIHEEQWPTLADEPLIDSDSRATLLAKLGRCLPHLTTEPHEPTRLDLFGQVSAVVFDGTFDAILTGETDLAEALFGALFSTWRSASTRIGHDLRNHYWQARVVHTLEPLSGLMELSGCAIILQELGDSEVWERIRQHWDSARTAQGDAFCAFLAEAMSLLDGRFMISPGDVMRQSRRQRLSVCLRERGVVRSDDGYWPRATRTRRQPTEPKWSRIVDAFAPGGLGLGEKLTDLFMVVYLNPLLPEGVSLPRSAQSLSASIDEAKAGDRDA